MFSIKQIPQCKTKHLFLIVLFLLSMIGIILVSGLIAKNKLRPKNKVVPTQVCDNCNILIIDIDVLRADSLPCYGYFRNTAPNICNFATKSMLFADNYSTTTWTLSSLFSTITSLHPAFSFVWTPYQDLLPTSVSTLAETLQQNGYTTIFVSDGQFSTSILNHQNGGLRGYDQDSTEPLEKVIADNEKQTKPWFIHYHSSFLHFPYLLPDENSGIEKITPPKDFPTTTKQFEKKFNNYLKKNYTSIFKKNAINKYASIIFSQERERKDDTGFFELFSSIIENNNETEYLIDIWKPKYNAYMESFDVNSSTDVAYVKMLYDSNIKLLDEQLAPVINLIESPLHSNNTITVFMSDHGEVFGEYGKFGHEDDYHSQLFFTPLIIRTPSIAAKTINHTTSNMDIFPTILDLVSIKKLDSLQGQSLLSLIDDTEKNKERFVASQINSGFILQNRQWLYYLPSNASEVEGSTLYNKIDDSQERNNVITSNLDLANKLFSQADLLRSYLPIVQQKTNELQPIQIKNQLDPEKIERIKKEGYF